MGRMLEALKRSEEPISTPEPALAAVRPQPAQEAPAEEEMPFIEVGGPRQQSESKTRLEESTPRLELPTPRQASLQVWAPQGVALQSCSQPTLPRPRVAAELIAFHQPEHPVSQQYVALFNQLDGESSDGAAAVLVLTALTAGAGTTTATLNLAISGCKNHAKRICIVDANQRRPAAAARLGVNAAIGLQEVLEGKVALERAMQTTPVEGLQVLAGGAGESAHANADAVRWVLAWLRQRFDIILVDAPPVDSEDALKALLPAATAVYVVVDTTETNKPEVRALTRNAARLGSRLGGLIVAH
jgi:Mrp family chromosome partitioning ATPase